MNLDTMEKQPRTIFNRAHSQKFLSKEEEFALGYAIRDHDDVNALQALTAAHVRLAISYARKYSNMDRQDAEGLAMEGLMEAARRFDPEKGFRFATYAAQWMRAKINEKLISQSSIVKAGTTQAEKAVFFNRSYVLATLMQSHGVQEISQFTDEHWEEAARLLNEGDPKKKNYKPRQDKLSVAQIKAAFLRLHDGDYSLDAPLLAEDGEGTRVDFVEDETPGVEEVLEKRSEAEWRRGVLTEAFSTLSEREKDMFVRRFLEEKPDTLEIIAEDYSMSGERVRQITTESATKIRTHLLGIVADRFGSHSVEADKIRYALENNKNFKP